MTSKGLQDKKIFMDKGDFNTYTDLLAKYKGQHKFKLFSYCLLPDRIHLLIETGENATISEIMHDLTSLYTKYYNGRYGKRGHLFESRFKSMLVEKSQYLLALTRQIHLSSAQNPKEYPYSSFHFFVQNPGAFVPANLAMQDEVQEVKNFLLNKSNPDAYEVFCLKADEKELEELAKGLRRGSVLGSESFRREVELKVKEHAAQQSERSADEGADKISRVVYIIAGAAVLVLSSASVYLYMSKVEMEKKYRQTVQLKEVEFADRTKFENQSPIAPTELEGSEWDIEILGLPSGRPEDKLKDKIRFQNGSFSSQVFGAQGFRSTRYVLIPDGKNAASWHCAQVNPSGETIRWEGQWRGSAMKGSFNYRQTVGGEQSFSFFSSAWAYLKETLR